ncbi:MAG TPA: 3D domain-containing protein [Bryobacteraceae bacterium]|nr:3D domain-containing protein [Bryobacteraceae bacterium]
MQHSLQFGGSFKFKTAGRIYDCSTLDLSAARYTIRATLIRVFVLVLLWILFEGHAFALFGWEHGRWTKFVATAYSISGQTKAQTFTQEGRTLAADPRVLPIGTVVEIRNAGPYSGQYVVCDTGRKIVGHKLDIYIASTHEAMQFGRRKVKVRILKPAPPTPKAQRAAAANAFITPKPPKDERLSAYYQYPDETGEETSVR